MRYQYMFEKEMKLSCHGWENCPVTVGRIVPSRLGELSCHRKPDKLKHLVKIT